MEQEIREFVSNLKTKYRLMPYVYNDDSSFVPGNPVYYSGPYWDEDEVSLAINSLLGGTWISAGENVREFEKQFSKRINQLGGVMVNSGSSANLVMIAALKKYFGWQDGDEIIVSVVGFPTTVAPIIQNNLSARFVDIEMTTLNFDLDQIERVISDRTRAIFLSPVLGNPPNIRHLEFICKKFNLQLILDSCDTLGTLWEGKHLNEFAVASSHSFYPAHTISTIEGGMVTSDNKEILDLARSFATWGRSCFPANTLITTKYGSKKIQDIVIGDLVLTHEGKFKPVTATFEKPYAGSMINVVGEKLKNLTMTPDHHVLVYRPVKGRVSDKNPEWIRADEIKRGDFLLESFDSSVEDISSIEVTYKTMFSDKVFVIPLERDLLRLCGYWLAEGSVTRSKKGSNGKGGLAKNKYFKYRVEFAFNENEAEYISDVIELMKRYFGVAALIRKHKNSEAITITATSRRAYEFFKQNFGSISYDKVIPEGFIRLGEDKLSQLLMGYWRGDGSSWKGSTSRWACYSICSTSQCLIESFRKILLRFNISPSFSRRLPENHISSVVNGTKVIAKHSLFSLSIYGKEAEKFNSIIEESETNFSPEKLNNFLQNKYAIFRVNSVNTVEDFSDFVYDLTVDSDHSYHADGIIVHNCFCQSTQNLLPNGMCKKRFSKWLPNYEGIVDHKYVFDNMGYNLKPTDMQGAVGLAQLKKLDEIIQKRKVSRETVTKYFSKLDVSFPKVLIGADVSWFGTPIICKNKEQKDKLVSYLEKNKIQTRNYFAGNLLLHPGFEHLDDFRKYPNANLVLDLVFFVGAAPHYGKNIFSYFKEVIDAYS